MISVQSSHTHVAYPHVLTEENLLQPGLLGHYWHNMFTLGCVVEKLISRHAWTIGVDVCWVPNCIRR